MEFAATIIKSLFGNTPVTIVTYNQHKIAQLTKYGVHIGSQSRLQVPYRPELKEYWEDKRDFLDHEIEID